jgi:ribosomal protein L11 methyltransferase
LIRLSKAVKDYLKDGGRIVLSGIIEGRAEDVRKAYSDAGFQFLKEETMGDWRAMMFGNAAK